VLLRFAIYTVFAYGLMLYLTLNNYDRALMDLKNKIMMTDKEINFFKPPAILVKGAQETIRDFEGKNKGTVPPLKILDIWLPNFRKKAI